MNEENELLYFRAKLLKALADPLRLQILQFLSNGEKCVCDIIPELDVVQPLVSRHLGILKKNGLIIDRKDGNKRFYSITDERTLEIIESITPDFQKAISERIMQMLV